MFSEFVFLLIALFPLQQQQKIRKCCSRSLWSCYVAIAASNSIWTWLLFRNKTIALIWLWCSCNSAQVARDRVEICRDRHNRRSRRKSVKNESFSFQNIYTLLLQTRKCRELCVFCVIFLPQKLGLRYFFDRFQVYQRLESNSILSQLFLENFVDKAIIEDGGGKVCKYEYCNYRPLIIALYINFHFLWNW